MNLGIWIELIVGLFGVLGAWWGFKSSQKTNSNTEVSNTTNILHDLRDATTQLSKVTEENIKLKQQLSDLQDTIEDLKEQLEKLRKDIK